ncbi:MAG: transcription initiation factor TFIIIB [Bacillota bacterium]|nr:transcription initiation factor TFIIIB [Bacillota bacterium]
MGSEKCPACGSQAIGEGAFSGYANLSVKGKMASSKVTAYVCSDCGLIIAMYADKPEKFTPPEV